MTRVVLITFFNACCLSCAIAGQANATQQSITSIQDSQQDSGKQDDGRNNPPADLDFNMKSVGEEDIESIEKAEPLNADELKRYTDVARKLVESINSEDKEGYRALFTDAAWESSFTWWREMFAGQISSFGRIEKAYVPRRGLVSMGDLAYRGDNGAGATVVVKFEESMGGAFSFELNEQNKIVSCNVFIKKELVNFEDSQAKPIFELK